MNKHYHKTSLGPSSVSIYIDDNSHYHKTAVGPSSPTSNNEKDHKHKLPHGYGDTIGEAIQAEEDNIDECC